MEMLYPMFGMITLSGLVVAMLLASRLPGVIKLFGNLQFAKHADVLRPQLPERLRYITDNYNHVMEQPTLFYAVVVYIHLAQHTHDTHLLLAWTYVGLRAIHSGIQLTSNNVTWRASCFALSTAILLSMIVIELAAFV